MSVEASVWDAGDEDYLRLLLAAAETVHPKLMSLLALGPDAVDTSAYAIKSRVKAYDSAVAKILEKRVKDPSYSPHTMTDVIGVRLLCLWPDDISAVLGKLIRVIDEVSGTGLSSFSGHSLADTLTEVIVYKAANSPAVYDVIGKQLKTWLLSHGRAGDCVKVKDSPRDRPYSSVHLVVRCHVQTMGKWVGVPVEIQVRTSLEDVWSEVDHRLRYKRRGKSASDLGNTMLDQLKVQLDSVASYVTMAREAFIPTPPSSSASLARLIPNSDPVERWGARSASPPQRASAVELSDALDTFYRDFERATHPEAARWDERLAGLIARLRDMIAARRADPSAAEADEQEWLFASRMELGQLLLWRGRLRRSERTLRAEDLPVLEEITEDCLKTYLELINSNRFEHSALLWFRFGNALLDLRGDFEQAYVYLKRAYAELAGDKSLERTPPAVVIPRMYAYVLWRLQNARYRSAIQQFGMHTVAAEHSLPFIREAIAVMAPLLDAVDTVDEGSAFWTPTVERARIANNLLSYVWYLALSDAQARGACVSGGGLPEAVLQVVGKNLVWQAYTVLAKQADRADTEASINHVHSLATTAFLLKHADRERRVTNLKVMLDGGNGANRKEADVPQMREDLVLLEAKEG